MNRVKLTYGTAGWERFEIISQKEAVAAMAGLGKILRSEPINLHVDEKNPFAKWTTPDGRFIQAELVNVIGS